MLKIEQQQLNGVYTIRSSAMSDERGSFCRTYCSREFDQHGLKIDWLQQNISYNKERGTVRGLHARKNPFGEYKLIRCIKGSAFDVLVDFRKNSFTYGKTFSIVISEENGISLLVPPGVAHGFQTLENDTKLTYLHSELYNEELETGFYFADRSLKIDWPLSPINLSTRDKNLQYFGEEYYL